MRFDFKLPVAAPPNIDGRTLAELRQLVAKLVEENAEQQCVIADLREEIARLNESMQSRGEPVRLVVSLA